MEVKPKSAFYAAVRAAHKSADRGEDEVLLTAALKKGERSEGISYAEFHACYKLVRSQDSNWSVSEALEGCEVDFLKPVVPPRNPELEARVQRLRKQQENRDYRAMVKNVDHVLIKDPAESVGAQLKQVRVQVTNVVQLILTVIGSFVFAYKLVDYNLEGATLIDKIAVGVATALLVGLCDFYFIVRQMFTEDAKLHKKED